MKKMSYRKYDSYITTDAYKNNLRDNENADKLKALLNSD